MEGFYKLITLKDISDNLDDQPVHVVSASKHSNILKTVRRLNAVTLAKLILLIKNPFTFQTLSKLYLQEDIQNENTFQEAQNNLILITATLQKVSHTS